jgi:hypothetical protein
MLIFIPANARISISSGRPVVHRPRWTNASPLTNIDPTTQNLISKPGSGERDGLRDEIIESQKARTNLGPLGRGGATACALVGYHRRIPALAELADRELASQTAQTAGP